MYHTVVKIGMVLAEIVEKKLLNWSAQTITFQCDNKFYKQLVVIAKYALHSCNTLCSRNAYLFIA